MKFMKVYRTRGGRYGLIIGYDPLLEKHDTLGNRVGLLRDYNPCSQQNPTGFTLIYWVDSRGFATPQHKGYCESEFDLLLDVECEQPSMLPLNP